MQFQAGLPPSTSSSSASACARCARRRAVLPFSLQILRRWASCELRTPCPAQVVTLGRCSEEVCADQIIGQVCVHLRRWRRVVRSALCSDAFGHRGVGAPPRHIAQTRPNMLFVGKHHPIKLPLLQRALIIFDAHVEQNHSNIKNIRTNYASLLRIMEHEEGGKIKRRGIALFCVRNQISSQQKWCRMKR
jgi:hypothetical protein